MASKPTSEPAHVKVDIDQILISDRTRTRARINREKVNEYAEAIQGGALFRPVDVFVEPGSMRYYLADGEHRILALKSLNRTTVGAYVHDGDQRAAFEFSLTANARHGLPRSNEDKRRSVELVLEDQEYKDYSLRQVADLVQVSHELVRQVQQELTDHRPPTSIPEKEPAEGNARPRRAPPSADDIDAREVKKLLVKLRDRVNHEDGASAYKRLQLIDSMELVESLHDWLSEVIAADVHVDDMGS